MALELDHNVWKLIAGHVGLANLPNLLQTCRFLNRHLRSFSDNLWRLECPELRPGYRYNSEQLNVTQQLMAQYRADPKRCQFLIRGEVGSGKTMAGVRLACLLAKPRLAILVPVNLINQWCAELDRFFPKLEYFKAHGYVRDRDQKARTATVLLTTPHTFKNIFRTPDVKDYTVIVDEVHRCNELRLYSGAFGYTIGLSAETLPSKLLNTPHEAVMRSLVKSRFHLNYVPTIYPSPILYDKSQFINASLELKILPSDHADTIISGHIYPLKDKYTRMPVPKLLEELQKRFNYTWLIYFIRQWSARRERGLVLFSSPEHCIATATYLQLVGIQPQIVLATKNKTIRMHNLDIFRESGQVLLSTFKIMSEGLNLPQANNLVFFEVSSSPHYYSQAIGRLQRVGQKYRQLNIHFIMDNNGAKYYNQKRLKGLGFV